MNHIFSYKSLVHATAGATGSIFAMSCIYPLDNVKFRMQLQDELLKDKTTLEALFYILQKEGVESLYKGIKPLLISLGVSNFIYFYSFHGLQTFLPQRFKGSAKLDLLISSIAGVINVLTTSPLWVVNSRLKLQQKHYAGLLDGLVYIARSEGIGSLWSGLGPSLVLVSNPAMHFTVYEALKRRVPWRSASAYFIMGAISKMVATIATYPIQIVQAQQRVNENINMVAMLLTILKQKGAPALYNGLEAKLLQTVLAAALTFMTYEKIAQYIFYILLGKTKESLYRGLRTELMTIGITNFVYFYALHGLKLFLSRENKISAKFDLILSITAGIINITLTSPFMVVNTRMKSYKQPFAGIMDGIFYIANTEGIISLWSGFFSSLLLVSNPAINFTIYEALKRHSQSKTAIDFFIKGAVSKMLATIVTYPLQLVQTHQRSNKEYNIGTIIFLWSLVKRRGLCALYNGLEAKLVQTVLNSALTFMTYEKIVMLMFYIFEKNRIKFAFV